MAFLGTRSSGEALVDAVQGFSNAAVTANQILQEYTAVHYGRIGGIAANAVTAGVGAGSTVIDVLKNGVSIWTNPANRPTLAALSTGQFANTAAQIRAFVPGDRITIQVATVPATTGHARVSATVGLEKA